MTSNLRPIANPATMLSAELLAGPLVAPKRRAHLPTPEQRKVTKTGSNSLRVTLFSSMPDREVSRSSRLPYDRLLFALLYSRCFSSRCSGVTWFIGALSVPHYYSQIWFSDTCFSDLCLVCLLCGLLHCDLLAHCSFTYSITLNVVVHSNSSVTYFPWT